MRTGLFYILIFFSISSGFSQKKQKVDNKYEKGTLVDGYKEGLWSYYDNDILKIQIDYSKGKLVYLAKDTSKYAILTDNGWEMSNLDVYPHYLGSIEEFMKIIYSNLSYPKNAQEYNIKGTVLLGFEINLQGKIENAKIIKDIGYGCGSAIIKAFKKVPNYWLVARKGNKEYKSRYVLPVHFKIGKKKGDTKKELNKLAKAKEEYSPARYFPEVVVTSLGIKRIIRQNNLGKRHSRFPNSRSHIFR